MLHKCKAAVDVEDFYSNMLTTNEDRAQFNSKRGPGACAFLRALPSDPSLRFKNLEFMIALRLHLRLRTIHKFGVQPGMPCHCNRETKHGGNSRLTEDHLLNCNAAAVMTRRHEALKNVFASILKDAKLAPVYEELAGPGTGKINRYDISADRYNSNNQDLKIDVTVVNPCTRQRAAASAAHPSSTAIHQRNAKIAKYAKFLTHSDDFYPCVFETYGLMDTPVLGLISALAARVNNIAPDAATYTAPNFKSFAIQRLSCCLWRENACTVETVIRQSASQFEYEHYKSGSYEDVVYPQFDLSSSDFPPLLPKLKDARVTLINHMSFRFQVQASVLFNLSSNYSQVSNYYTAATTSDVVQDLTDLTLGDTSSTVQDAQQSATSATAISE